VVAGIHNLLWLLLTAGKAASAAAAAAAAAAAKLGFIILFFAPNFKSSNLGSFI
jgi:1-aminocyclopropane-1-carboxylate deaminase/D-cysteine desulfhydrase-like pyridoxal-dependent ACC family enzyme